MLGFEPRISGVKSQLRHSNCPNLQIFVGSQNWSLNAERGRKGIFLLKVLDSKNHSCKKVGATLAWPNDNFQSRGSKET